MEQLKPVLALVNKSRRHVRLNPPAMDAYFDDDFERELLVALDTALKAGGDPKTAYQLMQHVSEGISLGPAVAYTGMCIRAGLSPDARGPQGTILHVELAKQYPLPLEPGEEAASARDDNTQLPAGVDPGPRISLKELLDRHPTPNLVDSRGRTALDIVTAMTFDPTHGYYPDDQPEAVFYTNVEDTERGVERAEYGAGAFCMLVAAGWDPKAGRAPITVVRAAKAMYQHELEQLRTGKHAAQRAQGMLAGIRGVSEATVRQTVGTAVEMKTAQAQAMVAACQRMEAAAAAPAGTSS